MSLYTARDVFFHHCKWHYTTGNKATLQTHCCDPRSGIRPLHWTTVNLKQTFTRNFQPIIWYIWFSFHFLQAQLVRRLAAKILVCFKVVANAFHSLLFYMQASVLGFKLYLVEGWVICLVTVHLQSHWQQKGNAEEKKELVASKSSRAGPQLPARVPGQDSVIIIIVQDAALCFYSSGKLYFLFAEFIFLLAGVFLDRCNCVVLELPMTQPSPPKRISPAALLQQIPNNAFLRRYSPRSRFPKFRTMTQEIISLVGCEIWSGGRKWQMKEKVWDAISSMKTNNILNLAIQFSLQNSCSLNIQLNDYLLWVGRLAKLEHCETHQMPMGMTKSLLN